MNLVNLKNDIITYTVNKTEASSCYISVQNGEVTVCAPYYLTAAQIQEIVEEKKQWITAKLNEYKKSRFETPDFEPKTVKVFGKDYSFKVCYKNVKGPILSLDEDKIKITLPNKFKKTDLSPIIKTLIKKMYNTLAEKEVEMAMEKARLSLGFAPEDYSIYEMNGTLGKCTTDKKIIINPDIVMFDRKVIEYVVMHEFCHLKYKNHTKKFYELLEQHIPEYAEYAKAINNFQY